MTDAKNLSILIANRAKFKEYPFLQTCKPDPVFDQSFIVSRVNRLRDYGQGL